jgi:hypothetical protein
MQMLIKPYRGWKGATICKYRHRLSCPGRPNAAVKWIFGSSEDQALNN